MTAAEYYTCQYYAWEFRGRGWSLADEPIELEPPFVPFYRHAYRPPFIDDGKRHTIVSKLLEAVTPKKTKAVPDTDVFDYEELEPYLQQAQTNLAAFKVTLPKERSITPAKMRALVVMLSQSDRPISFEIIGTASEISILFVADEEDIHGITAYIKAYFPECAVINTDEYNDIIEPGMQTVVIDFGLQQEFYRPLQIHKSFDIDPLTSLFAILEELKEGEQAGIQILFQGVINQWSQSIVRAVTLPDGTSFFADDPHAPKLAQEKNQGPLFAVTIRAFAQGRTMNSATSIGERLSHILQNVTRSGTNQLLPLPDEDYDFDTRVEDICFRQSHRLGMLLNVDELVTLLHIPSETIVSKKLFGASRKTKEVPAIGKNKAFMLGENAHNGITTPVCVSVEDRLKHTHIIGVTGTGKSTLIASLVLQDVTKGMGVVLFDPHGDLVDDIIARIPATRLKDVVLVDPSDVDFPIGLNILQAHSDIEKEVLSSDLIAVFRRYTTSWGDQMNAVFGNAILAILESKQGGSLQDLRRFLVEREFRMQYLKNVSDPAVVYYWQKEYPLLKSNSIGPILTRLDTFLRPRSIRNLVVQKSGLNFETLLNEKKIILLKLSQGLIGVENSFLLGSLILSKIHQAVFRRQQQSERNPVFIYLDEFQNFITPSIQEMLSGIRKYNVGLILSHQDLHQLQRESGELINSIFGVYTRVVFRVGEPDAKKLQDGFNEFTSADLQNLGRGEAVVRIEQPQFDCSLNTIPLDIVPADEKEAKLHLVREHARKQYATTKEEVEESFLQSLQEIACAVEKKENAIKQKTLVVQQETIPKAEEVPQKPKKQPAIVEVPEIEEASPVDTDVSTHRYLQMFVKKMAEARGYIAVVERQLPDGSGSVDVSLSKEGKTIAIEISVTTDAEWEMHNIEKCIQANYDVVVSLSGDRKQLDKIEKKCKEGIAGFENKPVHFFTPDALFAFLDTTDTPSIPKEQIIKGYRVNVTYDALTQEEMERKRASVAKVVMDSLRKRNKRT